MFSDSRCIWIIANHNAIRMAFGPEHFNFEEREWPLGKDDRPLQQHTLDHKGHIMHSQPYKLHTFAIQDKKGAGICA